MRQIELIGPVDKRCIAYPLFKICDVLGKVLVITDDANFRRFSEDYSNEFTLGRSDFIITSDILKTVMEELAVKIANYDFIIYITTNTHLEGNDCVVYCHGLNQAICTEDVLSVLESVDHLEVLISTNKSNEKTTFLPMDSKTLGYVWNCEENKYFLPCKQPELVKLNAYLFSQVLGISKEEFAKLIVKEV